MLDQLAAATDTSLRLVVVAMGDTLAHGNEQSGMERGMANDAGYDELRVCANVFSAGMNGNVDKVCRFVNDITVSSENVRESC